ncbi:MAG: hypothetical protein IH880_03465 [Candidatus Marinimicrobia bacterium]|nr:hypothetical protein [Candidatus Neomarinimicrobiota bacterium]MCH7887130.1 hypothetical protein [Candidatus Neomarinimicrobiota bacterium]
MTLFIFLSLSLGMLAYLSRILIRKRNKFYILVTIASLMSITSGLIAFGFVHFYAAVTSAIAIFVIIKIAIGLESDMMFLRDIYNEIDTLRKDNPDMNDEDIMMKVFEANFPDTSNSINKRIIETSEDIEEMLLRAIDYENSGKLKKSDVLEDSEIP